MSLPKISLGMAVFDDFHGAIFTIQSALLHDSDLIKEIIIVDNNPDSNHGKMLGQFCKSRPDIIKYIPMKEITGTAAPRNKVFEVATSEIVVCCDPHVIFPKGSFQALSGFFLENPESLDLVQGPLLYDNGISVSTHFDLSKWDGEMWGQWGTDEQYKKDIPFEIPAQGLGAFACRKGTWLGFNKDFRGFGGEEGYIHEKYRKAGRKCWCIPKFLWWHRFGRPDGVPYPLTKWNKVRNYIIGFQEIGLDTKPIYDYFVGKGLINEEQWSHLLKWEMENEVPAKTGGCGCTKKEDNSAKTIEDWYNWAANTPSDINEHVPTLKELSSKCEVVVEFGIRTGISTAGILAGKPKKAYSYDFSDRPEVRSMAKAAAKEGNTEYQFWIGESLGVDIPECDLLFIDTKHTGDYLLKELEKHSSKVKKWIALHDTVIFGEKGEDGSQGLLHGTRKFLYDHPEWFTIRHDLNNHGFTVLSRVPEEAPPRLPSTIKMAMNYGKSEINDMLQGRKRVSLEVAEARYAICTSNGGKCPLGQRRIDDDRCAGCGCFLWEQPGKENKTGKVWRVLDSCPHSLWGPSTDNMEDVPQEVKV